MTSIQSNLYFCGEVVADLLESVPQSGQFDLLLGGSQFHGAIGASRAVAENKMNVQIAFVGQISEDTFGQRFIQKFHECGVDTSSIKRTPKNTTLAIVSMRPGHENQFSFYGRDTAEQMLYPLDLPKSLPRVERKICYFGSVSTVMEPAGQTWLDFAKLQSRDGLVMYDLNTRPKLIADRAQYQERVKQWAATAHVVKASDADIAWAYPNATAQEVAQIWLSAGAKMAVITQGPQGALAFTRKTQQVVYDVPLYATNTVGAGDNFNAGLALGLVNQSCFTPMDIESLNDEKLRLVIQSANQTAANHLKRLGAKLAAAA